MAVRLLDKLEEYQLRFIKARIGAEAMSSAPSVPVDARLDRRRALRRVRSILASWRQRAAEACVRLFLGREGAAALRAGLFRQRGEVHQWMYDRYSLKRAMAQAGFTSIQICTADESGIPGFAHFGLETRNCQPRKPDSLYMDGKKPGPS